MVNRGNIKDRKKSVRSVLEKRDLVRFARVASANAKRTSIALNLPFEIIKEGHLYKVYKGNMTKTASLKKTAVDKRGLRKGSKICLK